MENRTRKVCVTGGAGFVGSWLVKKLLVKGYTVHATLRPHLEDKSMVDILKSFPEAETRLFLFEAEIYDPNTFEKAIDGCECVFHVATAFQHIDGYQFKNTTEASVAAGKSIATFCERSGTVKRLIYTSSLLCASPLKEDGSGYKDAMDETCWTPLNLIVAFLNDFMRGYVESKMQTEKEILTYGSKGDNGGLEVITLELGLVAGDTDLPYSCIPGSVTGCLCQLTNDEYSYQSFRDTEELLGKVPIAHIDDVCEAHIFCMEKPSINGRFFCASASVSSTEIAYYYQQHYPEFHLKQEYLEVPKREIKWGGTRLMEKGFEYKNDMKMILNDSVKCAKRTGYLK